jgi:hypothetical protein
MHVNTERSILLIAEEHFASRHALPVLPSRRETSLKQE